MDANFTPSFEMTSGALTGRPSLGLCTYDRSQQDGGVQLEVGSKHACKQRSALATTTIDLRNKDQPTRLWTLPVMVRSGRSMVFTTANTINMEFANVQQLKKL